MSKISKPTFLSIFFLCLLTACATTPEKKAGQASKNAPEEERRTAINAKKMTFGDAITSPLSDLNLKKIEIPPVLIKAVENPYDLAKMDRCESIAAEVARLDEVLGYDYDEAPPPKNNSLTKKGSDMVSKAAVGAVEDASNSIVPFRGIVRKVSGADAHTKNVNRAVDAGRARRSYLKGIGMNKNCAPPAAPSWYKPKVYVSTRVTNSNKTLANTSTKKKSNKKQN